MSVTGLQLKFYHVTNLLAPPFIVNWTLALTFSFSQVLEKKIKYIINTCLSL